MHPLGELPVTIAQHLVGLNGSDGGQVLHGLSHTMDIDGASMFQGWPHQRPELVPMLVVVPLIRHSGQRETLPLSLLLPVCSK